MSDDFSMTVNVRTVGDELLFFVTTGGKIGMEISSPDGRYASTYLTPDEWDAVRTQGDRIMARLREKAKGCNDGE